MLLKAWASSVLAIEANRRCFLKCLVVKEMVSERWGRLIARHFASVFFKDQSGRHCSQCRRANDAGSERLICARAK